jgi:hypothetical protein
MLQARVVVRPAGATVLHRRTTALLYVGGAVARRIQRSCKERRWCFPPEFDVLRGLSPDFVLCVSREWGAHRHWCVCFSLFVSAREVIGKRIAVHEVACGLWS